MVRFNEAPDISKDLYEREDATLNYEGSLAFKLDPLTELYLRSASTLAGEPKYYTDEKVVDKELVNCIHTVAKIDPEFILQLAVYCREKLYLRSIPLMLIAEFANDPNCKGKVTGARKYVERTIRRADELTELIAYQLARNKKVSRKLLLFEWDNIPKNDANILNTIKRKYGIHLDSQEIIERINSGEDIIKKHGDSINISDGMHEITIQLGRSRTKADVKLNGTKIDELAVKIEEDKILICDEVKLPMLIRAGVKKAFKKFDRYQISKYDKPKLVVKMRDAMFLTHPKPVDLEQKDIYSKLANKSLESPDTWEVMVSTGKMNWHEVINEIFHKNGKINNYMAQLKNLRNCLQDKNVTEEDIQLLCEMISNKDAVSKSKQFPFRFLSAYKELKDCNEQDLANPIGLLHINDVMEAVDIAASYSVDNIPKLEGYTLIATDFSGSMRNKISKKSSIERFEIGAILSTIADKISRRVITGIFADEWKVIRMAKSSGILDNTLKKINLIGSLGYSTNGYKVIEYLLDNAIKVDRLMMFTDCQLWDSERRRTWVETWGDQFQVSFAERFLRYQKLYPDVRLYTFDLSGYGNVQIPDDTRNVCFIGGWSDRIFDFIQAFEALGDGKAVVNKIKAIKP